MIVTMKRRGHTIVWDGHRWLWQDTGGPAGWDRPCASCGEHQTAEGHDPCLGTLTGVSGACCGHGDTDGCYVMFDDGTALYEQDAATYLAGKAP